MSQPITPTIRSATRRSLFWILAVVFVGVIAVVTMIVRGAAAPTGDPLSATNAAPPGSMAVARVLADHGVKVVPSDTLKATEAALRRNSDSTLLVFDPKSRLDATQLRRLAELSSTVVLVTPSFSQLRALTPQLGQAGAAKSSPLSAGCALPAARNAKTISGGGNGYRVIDKGADATACFSSGKGISSVVQLRSDSGQVTILGAPQVLANETVAERGNAALALNLLGSTSTLVWYLPSIDDVAVTGLPTIAQLTPPWVSSVALLSLCIAIAAAFWKGRRMGPLVIENLPVVVRASETMEGRARLYQKNSSRLHALDALRIGSIARLARLCGLSRTASTTDVVATVGAVTGIDRAQLSGILVDAVPTNDSELIRLSDELLELEKAVAHAIAN
ncbi:MAG: DUF4350 domain-containing protein [Lacisediminihabitans sp.]